MRRKKRQTKPPMQTPVCPRPPGKSICTPDLPRYGNNLTILYSVMGLFLESPLSLLGTSHPILRHTSSHRENTTQSIAGRVAAHQACSLMTTETAKRPDKLFIHAHPPSPHHRTNPQSVRLAPGHFVENFGLPVSTPRR